MANNINYLMNYNHKNLPHMIVRNKILESIHNNKYSTCALKMLVVLLSYHGWNWFFGNTFVPMTLKI